MIDPLQPENLALIVLIGLIAGTLGGLLGVGGSVVIIPGLALVFGTGHNQHLYQAAAMVVNVAVAVPSALRHRRAGAVVPAVLRWMLPASILFIIAGVFISNLPVFEGGTGGRWLGRLLAGFLVYVIVMNIMKLRQPAHRRDNETLEDATITATRSTSVGGVMGVVAGLLGLGGGGIAVPLQQAILKLPLRNAIANSAAVMIFSAAIGAALKVATLDQHYRDLAGGLTLPPWRTALLVAAVLAPTAIIGARVGASLTHKLPLTAVRVAFVLLMVVAAYKMADLPL